MDRDTTNILGAVYSLENQIDCELQQTARQLDRIENLLLKILHNQENKRSESEKKNQGDGKTESGGNRA